MVRARRRPTSRATRDKETFSTTQILVLTVPPQRPRAPSQTVNDAVKRALVTRSRPLTATTKRPIADRPAGRLSAFLRRSCVVKIKRR